MHMEIDPEGNSEGDPHRGSEGVQWDPEAGPRFDSPIIVNVYLNFVTVWWDMY